ncbi:MAG: hypothetical protein ABRQ38_29875, partial [Candidatus Eremiobacterota bacterium]
DLKQDKVINNFLENFPEYSSWCKDPVNTKFVQDNPDFIKWLDDSFVSIKESKGINLLHYPDKARELFLRSKNT